MDSDEDFQLAGGRRRHEHRFRNLCEARSASAFPEDGHPDTAGVADRAAANREENSDKEADEASAFRAANRCSVAADGTDSSAGEISDRVDESEDKAPRSSVPEAFLYSG